MLTLGLIRLGLDAVITLGWLNLFCGFCGVSAVGFGSWFTCLRCVLLDDFACIVCGGLFATLSVWLRQYLWFLLNLYFDLLLFFRGLRFDVLLQV